MFIETGKLETTCLQASTPLPVHVMSKTPLFSYKNCYEKLLTINMDVLIHVGNHNKNLQQDLLDICQLLNH